MLQNIDLNNNRLLARITAVYGNKSDKRITDPNGDGGRNPAKAMFICYRISTTPSLPLPDLVCIIGDLDEGLNFHHSFFLAGNF